MTANEDASAHTWRSVGSGALKHALRGPRWVADRAMKLGWNSIVSTTQVRLICSLYQDQVYLYSESLNSPTAIRTACLRSKNYPKKTRLDMRLQLSIGPRLFHMSRRSLPILGHHPNISVSPTLNQKSRQLPPAHQTAVIPSPRSLGGDTETSP